MKGTSELGEKGEVTDPFVQEQSQEFRIRAEGPGRQSPAREKQAERRTAETRIRASLPSFLVEKGKQKTDPDTVSFPLSASWLEALVELTEGLEIKAENLKKAEFLCACVWWGGGGAGRAGGSPFLSPGETELDRIQDFSGLRAQRMAHALS